MQAAVGKGSALPSASQAVATSAMVPLDQQGFPWEVNIHRPQRFRDLGSWCQLEVSLIRKDTRRSAIRSLVTGTASEI